MRQTKEKDAEKNSASFFVGAWRSAVLTDPGRYGIILE